MKYLVVFVVLGLLLVSCTPDIKVPTKVAKSVMVEEKNETSMELVYYYALLTIEDSRIYPTKVAIPDGVVTTLEIDNKDSVAHSIEIPILNSAVLKVLGPNESVNVSIDPIRRDVFPIELNGLFVGSVQINDSSNFTR